MESYNSLQFSDLNVGESCEQILSSLLPVPLWNRVSAFQPGFYTSHLRLVSSKVRRFLDPVSSFCDRGLVVSSLVALACYAYMIVKRLR